MFFALANPFYLRSKKIIKFKKEDEIASYLAMTKWENGQKERSSYLKQKD